MHQHTFSALQNMGLSALHPGLKSIDSNISDALTRGEALSEKFYFRSDEWKELVAVDAFLDFTKPLRHKLTTDLRNRYDLVFSMTRCILLNKDRLYHSALSHLATAISLTSKNNHSLNSICQMRKSQILHSLGQHDASIMIAREILHEQASHYTQADWLGIAIGILGVSHPSVMNFISLSIASADPASVEFADAQLAQLLYSLAKLEPNDKLGLKQIQSFVLGCRCPLTLMTLHLRNEVVAEKDRLKIPLTIESIRKLLRNKSEFWHSIAPMYQFLTQAQAITSGRFDSVSFHRTIQKMEKTALSLHRPIIIQYAFQVITNKFQNR